MDNPRTHAEREAAQRADEAELQAAHTPGPWRWTYQGDSRAIVDAPRRNRGGQRFTMAEVEAFSPAETEANARLVAAAPALLEACQQVLARLDLEAQERGPDAVFPCAAQRDTLRAAIALATLPPMAGGNKAPHCPDCGDSGAARDCEPCLLATLPPMAGGSEDDTVSFPYGAQRHLAGRRLLCRAGHRLDSHTPPGTLINPPRAEAAIAICRCSRLVDGSCMNLWPGHPAYGTCRCACHAPPMAGGAPTPADDPAGPGAPAEAAPAVQPWGKAHWHACLTASHSVNWQHTDPGCTLFGGVLCPTCATTEMLCSHGYATPYFCSCPPGEFTRPHQPTTHTHPCPTCHHDRSCACTTFAPGEPLECATCSNCRGW